MPDDLPAGPRRFGDCAGERLRFERRTRDAPCNLFRGRRVSPKLNLRRRRDAGGEGFPPDARGRSWMSGRGLFCEAFGPRTDEKRSKEARETKRLYERRIVRRKKPSGKLLFPLRRLIMEVRNCATRTAITPPTAHSISRSATRSRSTWARIATTTARTPTA